MELKWRNVLKVMIMSGIILGLMIGVQTLYQKNFVYNKLETKLAAIEGINDVQIKGNEIIINISKVDNIKEVYNQIAKLANEKTYTIVLTANPDDSLSDVAERSDLAIHEALIKGNFTEMEEKILQYAQGMNIDAKIFLDNQRVYIQLEQGDHYLYHIVDREINNSSNYNV